MSESSYKSILQKLSKTNYSCIITEEIFENYSFEEVK